MASKVLARDQRREGAMKSYDAREAKRQKQLEAERRKARQIRLTKEDKQTLETILGKLDRSFFKQFEALLNDWKSLKDFEDNLLNQKQRRVSVRKALKHCEALLQWWDQCDPVTRKMVNNGCDDNSLRGLPFVLHSLEQSLKNLPKEFLCQRGAPKTKFSTLNLTGLIAKFLEQHGVELRTYDPRSQVVVYPKRGKFARVLRLSFRVCGVFLVSDLGPLLKQVIADSKETKSHKILS